MPFVAHLVSLMEREVRRRGGEGGEERRGGGEGERRGGGLI